MTNRQKKLVLLTLIIVAGLGSLAYVNRHNAIEAYRDWRRGTVPPAISRTEFESLNQTPKDKSEEELIENSNQEPEQPNSNNPSVQTPTQPESENDPEIKPEPEPEQEPENKPEPEPETPTEEDSLISTESINLKVPFMVQAPYAVWDDLHGEACEEASAIMLAAYYRDEESITPEEAEERIMSAVEWEQNNLGYHLDTTAEETARMLNEHFGISSIQVISIDSLDDIRVVVANGDPVIVPAYGKALGNPYFRNGGPLYHMLVIKGFDGERVITNDPGTKRGADFIYDDDVLWNAIHDWNNGDVSHGEKVMIYVK